ncbi:PREDICTED: uncharacterized protein LOC106741893 [Dinoponera quadriceps]|uniref:Uncharacterized protein LOC106741893 n=1 Tax=Dinoponera quadriceps TaxID=609295 RepID=A0A6P3WV89_DINQU|nr:PREDICTED: uncharacterized protein LOC106741893 [Dinoponera quadriceps]
MGQRCALTYLLMMLLVGAIVTICAEAAPSNDTDSGDNSIAENGTDGIKPDDVKYDIIQLFQCVKKTKTIGPIVIQFLQILNMILPLVPHQWSALCTYYATVMFWETFLTVKSIQAILKEFTLMLMPLIELRIFST